MRLASIFNHLPHTILVTSLAFATNALPVESAQLLVLTPDNFKDTVSHGVWFVEHFSPYCGHCRRFAPTWEKLVEHYSDQTDPGIQLAQVNCAVHGDLCRDNNVDGYPQMNLYRDGDFVDTYKQARDFDLITEYISTHVTPPPEPEATSEPLPPPPSAAETTYDTEQLIAETFKGPEQRIYNPSGNVVVLNEKTFQNTVSDGHVFVKFYAPWCGHCKKLAPIWKELARSMHSKLTIAEVDCEENGALCRSQGITGYPMLFYYPNGRDTKMEYTGGRKLDQLTTFSERLSGPPVLALNEGELSQVVADHPVVYLLLRAATDKDSVKQLVDSSHVLFGTPPIYISSSSALFKKFNLDSTVSVLLALKDHRENSPMAQHRFSKYHQKELETWLIRHKLPTVLELHSDTFQEVMNAPSSPLVVLVAAPKSESHNILPSLTSIAIGFTTRQKHDKSDENVVFTWMDSDKWATWLKNMYGIKQTLPPAIVVANHSALVYYNVDQFGSKIELTSASINSAVTGALRGTIPYRHSENFVERWARYLNTKMVTVEKFVSKHPWSIVAFVLLVIIGLYFLFRRILTEEDPEAGGQYRRLDAKGERRLD